MLTQEVSRTLTSYLLAVMLAALVSGCGGSPGGSGSTTTIGADVDNIVARTGPIVAVQVSQTAVLDGSKSITTLAEPLSYSWSFSSKPDTSMAQLLNPSTANPSFIADVRGTYLVQLVVSAAGVSSQRAIQLVIAAIDILDHPTGPVNHQGLSSNCAQCHNGEIDVVPGPGKIPRKSSNHLATGNSCETCHTPLGFTNTPFVDHQEVFGNCSECHNGVLAIGKSEFHVPTVVECDACHNTTSFVQLSLDGSFDHTGISSGCSVCHNGIVTIGKDARTNPPHIQTDSDCVFCHTTVSFLGAIPDHSDPAILATRCDSCHDGVTAIGMDAKINHIVLAPPPATQDCAMCHNTNKFVDAFVDHTGPAVEGAGITCDSCHDGIVATGKPAVGHLVTVLDCVACHAPGGSFAGGTFNHLGIDVNNCGLCHDGVVAIDRDAKSNPAHIPTTRDCSDCHDTNNFTSFAGIIFDHSTTTAGCASCHASSLATGKRVNHIPALDDCRVCHTSAGFSGATIDHSGISRGCEGCHISRFLPTNAGANPNVVKAANHLPTNQDCYLCHTTTPLAFSPSIFDHLGISADCASCHDGNPDYVGVGAIGKTADHPATNQHCGVCHNTQSFASAVFDHSGRGDDCVECHGDNATGAVTKKNVGHVLTTQDCSVCHLTGTFAPAVFDHTGIVDNCASCHGVTARGLSADHIPIDPATQDCSVCHSPVAFAGAKFDHQGILDNCATCHNGNTATGKPNSHVPTIGDCSECHETTGFVPATFDHVGIVDNCVSCHATGFATPKKFNHVATNQDCGVCHNPVGFIPATFDHTGIVDNCASCHGVTATGMDAKTNPPHIATGLDCSSCHTTATFVGGTWTHDGSSTGVCKDCHNGTDATGLPPTGPRGHFDTSAQCDTCHSTQGWGPTNNFSHTTPEYPGDHNSNVGCSSCHTNNSEIIQSYRNSTYTGSCAACHANDYKPGPHKWYENPSTKYTVGQLRDCAGACHVYSDSSLNTRTKTRNSKHRARDRDF